MGRFTLGVSAIAMLSLAGSPGMACGQQPKRPQGLEGKVKVIDSFDQKTPGGPYSSYHGEVVANQGGYGIYYEEADVQLSRVVVGKGDNALRIQYALPPLRGRGNWFSVRKEFSGVMGPSPLSRGRIGFES